MSDVYIARQPIFDREMQLYGYELLYGKGGSSNPEGMDDDEATAILIDNFFSFGFYRLIDSTRGFVNFTKHLLSLEAPMMLPPEKLIVEISRQVEADEKMLGVCAKLKELGYVITLDDFIPDASAESSQILEYVDILKMDCLYSADEARKCLPRKCRNHAAFLAKKVETDIDYKRAKSTGFQLFQGAFFSKPAVINARAIGALTDNLLPIMSELSASEPDYKAIADIFERDLDLSYKLLRLANSVFSGARYTIKSIRHALVRIGTQELIRWVNLMLLRDMQNSDNAELVKTSLIRGKMLALFAAITDQMENEPDYFFTGIFSSIDALLGEDMEQITERLPLTNIVKEALMGQDNFLRKGLDAIISYENARWHEVDAFLNTQKLGRDVFISLYMDALEWQQATLSEYRQVSR